MLNDNEFHPYFKTYLDPLKDRNDSLLEMMEDSGQKMVEMLLELPEEKETHRYAPGKWTIKEMLQHIIDTERVFQYRALRFSRNDKSELPGFDQDLFNDNAEANKRSLQKLIDEFIAVRQSSITLFSGLSDEALQRMGKASGNMISVRAIGYLVTGHQLHHQRVFLERYL